MGIWKRLRKILERRSPWLAALLNLMWGLGYLYAGRKKLVGSSLLTLVWVYMWLGGVFISGAEISAFVYYLALVGPILFVCFALARDAYIETKKGNREA